MSPRLRAALVAALLLALFLGSNALLLRLQLDNSPEAYSPPDSPAVQFNRELRAQFPEDQVLVLLFRGPVLFEADFLARLDAAAQALEQHPLVERVLAPTRFDHIAGTEDGFAVEPLIDPDGLDKGTPAERQARALGDRFAKGLLLSEQGDAMALIVRPVRLDNSLQRAELMEAANIIVARTGLSPWLSATAGQVALDVAELRSMVRDTLVFVPATMLLGLLMVWWLFRRPLAVLLTMLAVGVSVSVTVALIVLAGRSYSLVTSMIPPLIASLTVALLLHLFNAVYRAARRGVQGPERIRQAVHEVRRPALYTALTTTAGLASLGLSPIPPITTFGLAAAAGALLLYPLVIWLVPVLLGAWDRHDWPAPGRSARWLDWMVAHAPRVALRHPLAVVVLVAIVMAAGAPFLTRVKAETDLYQFFGSDHWITRSTHAVENALAGVSLLEVVFDGPGRDSLKEPQTLQALRDFQTWLEAQAEVDRTDSMAEIVEEMNWAFHGEDPAFRKVPESRNLVSQYLFIYDGRDLYDLVDREFARTRLTMNLSVHGANEIQAVMDRISAHLPSTELGKLGWHFAGTAYLFAEQEDLLVQGQIRSLLAAVALMTGFMLLLWRAVVPAVLSMIPNLAPIVLIFIIMGISGIRLDMATALIASVAVGIAVDDTIHIYHGYGRQRARGVGPVRALLSTFRGAGRAVTATTAILCGQFLLLTASAFVPTEQFGLLTAVGLLTALVFDLLLLPALLLLAGRMALPRGLRA